GKSVRKVKKSVHAAILAMNGHIRHHPDGQDDRLRSPMFVLTQGLCSPTVWRIQPDSWGWKSWVEDPFHEEWNCEVGVCGSPVAVARGSGIRPGRGDFIDYRRRR